MDVDSVSLTTNDDETPRSPDLWRRLGGMLADGLLLVVAGVVLIPLLSVPYAGGVLYLGALIAVMVWAWHRGASPGMRSARIHLVDAKTGGLPRPLRLIPRAIVALAFFAAVIIGIPLLFGFGLYSMMTSELGPPNDEHRLIWSDYQAIWLTALGAILVGGVFANLWMVWDRRHQTLIDKLSGVVVLEDAVPATPSGDNQPSSPVPPPPAVSRPTQSGPTPA